MKKLIAKYTPSQETIRSNKHLRFLDKYLRTENLWRMNRKSVAGGVAVGLFSAWIPIPFQMILATILAIVFSVNLPIPVALVWITNPITMPFLYSFAYWLGAKLLGTPIKTIAFEPSADWLIQILGQIWQPFLFGCFVIAIVSAVVGFFAVNLTWRYHVVRRWKAKQRKHSL